jgi:hypothetical protein
LRKFSFIHSLISYGIHLYILDFRDFTVIQIQEHMAALRIIGLKMKDEVVDFFESKDMKDYWYVFDLENLKMHFDEEQDFSSNNDHAIEELQSMVNRAKVWEDKGYIDIKIIFGLSPYKLFIFCENFIHFFSFHGRISVLFGFKAKQYYLHKMH